MTPRTPPPTPAVLLVEDDPASRAFLAAATAALPARVVEADGCRAALEAAASAPPFDLWLVDQSDPAVRIRREMEAAFARPNAKAAE